MLNYNFNSYMELYSMRFVDGWHVPIQVGTTWGYDNFSDIIALVFLLIFGGIVIYYLIKKNDGLAKLTIIAVLLICGIGTILCFHSKPVNKITIEYKVECYNVDVNRFFEVFELQSIVDETHYIVREKNWRDNLY